MDEFVLEGGGAGEESYWVLGDVCCGEDVGVYVLLYLVPGKT